jgi:uncharacterized protein YjbK
VSFGRGFLVYGGSGGRQKFSKLLSEVVRKQISANNKKNPATRVKSGSGGRQKFNKLLSEVVRKQIPAANKKTRNAG